MHVEDFRARMVVLLGSAVAVLLVVVALSSTAIVMKAHCLGAGLELREPVLYGSWSAGRAASTRRTSSS